MDPPPPGRGYMVQVLLITGRVNYSQFQIGTIVVLVVPMFTTIPVSRPLPIRARNSCGANILKIYDLITRGWLILKYLMC